MKYILKTLSLLSIFCLDIHTSSTAWAQEKPTPNARGVVEDYVNFALAGKADKASALGVAGQSPSRKERIEEFQGMIAVKVLKIVSVLGSDKKGQAIAISEAVKLTKANPDGRDTGCLVFSLVKFADKWLVKDIDFRTEEESKEVVKVFEKRTPDAKEIPAKSEK